MAVSYAFTLKPRAPFQFTPHLDRFSVEGRPSPHIWLRGARLMRVAVPTSAGLVGVDARFEGEPWSPRVEAVARAPSREAAEEAVALLGLMVRADFDYSRFVEELRGVDERLYLLASRYPGLRPGRCTSVYAALLDSIVKQRIALPAALRVYSRLVEAYGWRLEAGGALYYWHPQADRLAALSPDDLRRLGLTRLKARALIEVALAEVEGRLPSLREVEADPWSVAGELTRLYGVGRWTAQLAVAMVSPGFPLGPMSDLAVARGLRVVLGARDAEGAARRLLERLPGLGGLVLYLVAYEYESLKRRGASRPPG